MEEHMMAKALGIGLLVIGAVLLLGGTAEAHWIQVSSRLIYHSVFCDAALKTVPNPATHPAQATCKLTVEIADTLCRNNGGNLAPGQVPNLVVSATVPVLPANVTKKSGMGFVSVEAVPACNTLDGRPPAEPGDPCLLGVTSEVPGACPNAQNWDVVGLIVRETTAEILVQKCLDATCSGPKIDVSKSVLACVLPPGVTFDTDPGEGIEYQCDLISNVHLN
jgi:hypothetical protein